MDTDLLNDARLALDAVQAVCFSSKSIRYSRQLLYNNLQMFDVMLRETSDLSAFASAENNIAISTTELILAASAAA